MTYPAVDDLPEGATSTLLGVCAQLSQSRHPGLARWAASVSDALLVRLVSVTPASASAAPRTEPCGHWQRSTPRSWKGCTRCCSPALKPATTNQSSSGAPG